MRKNGVKKLTTPILDYIILNGWGVAVLSSFFHLALSQSFFILAHRYTI
jgi:hypothetical protein